MNRLLIVAIPLISAAPAYAQAQAVPGSMTTINRVLDVLEKRGVEFIENGVRLTKRPRR
jgi:hypothetical protein